MQGKELLIQIENKFGKESEVYSEVQDLLNFKTKVLRYARKLDNVQETLKLDRPVKSSKALFKNSSLKSIKFIHHKLAANRAHALKYRGVDIEHYMQQVSDWSDKRNKLCTDRGWMVYLRQFMDSDLKNGKLKKIKNQSQYSLDGYVPNV